MISDNQLTIVQRIEQLEKENQRLRRWGRLLFLGIVLIVAVGAAATIDNQMILRDRDGRTRFAMFIHPQEIRSVVFQMFNDRSRQRLRFGDDPVNGTYFFIEGQTGRKRIEFGVDSQDQAYFRIKDPQGRIIRSLP